MAYPFGMDVLIQRRGSRSQHRQNLKPTLDKLPL